MSNEQQITVLLKIVFFISLLVCVGLFVNDIYIFNDYEKYKLNNNVEISCKFSQKEGCGMRFLECTNGLEYRCQTNVTILGVEK